MKFKIQKINNDNKLTFVSFGSDEKYLKLSYDLLVNLSRLYPSSNLINFGFQDLPFELNEYCKKYKKGFGYMIWKPYVIRKVIKNCNFGDIIFYADGRCAAPKSVKIKWLNKFLSNSSFDIAAWNMKNNLEFEFTNGDLFNQFEFDLYGDEASSGQFASGIFSIRLNSLTKKLIEEWEEFIFLKKNMCRDDESFLKNHEKFKFNRHDQSVFSLMLKKYKKYHQLNILEVSNREIYSRSSVVPHCKGHPDQGFKLNILKNNIKRYLPIL